MADNREEHEHDPDWRARRRHPRKLSEFYEELGERTNARAAEPAENTKEAEPREH